MVPVQHPDCDRSLIRCEELKPLLVLAAGEVIQDGEGGSTLLIFHRNAHQLSKQQMPESITDGSKECDVAKGRLCRQFLLCEERRWPSAETVGQGKSR